VGRITATLVTAPQTSMPNRAMPIGHLQKGTAMQATLAILSWTTVLPFLPLSMNETSGPKVPDQAKLRNYLEKCDKAVKSTWVVIGCYTKKSEPCFGVPDVITTGREFLLRIPTLPNVYLWQETSKSKFTNHFDSLYKLCIGPFRLFSTPGLKIIGFDCPLGETHLFHLDWCFDDWLLLNGGASHLVFWNSQGFYDASLTLPAFRRKRGRCFEKLHEGIVMARGPLALLMYMGTKQSGSSPN
jgi:hypothetical protein